MKLILPSAGLLGTKSVDVREPKFSDLRYMNNINLIDSLIKIEFVKRLIDPHVLLSKITKYDLEYIFTVAVASIRFNKFKLRTSCNKCAAEISVSYDIADQDLVMLDTKGYPFSRKVNNVEYTWHVLSAQNELDAIEYALTQDDYQAAYEDAVVCFTFGWSLDCVDKAKNLDPSLYLSAFLFQNSMFHGVRMHGLLKCPKCGADNKIIVDVSSDLAKADIQTLMEFYANVTDVLSFEAFLDITVPEYTSLVKTFNDRLDG